MIRKKLTKVIATISDRRCEPEFIEQLHEAGMNVVRLNTAHQTQEETLKVIKNIRRVSEGIAILLDTKGPEIRTSDISEDINVITGDEVVIGTGDGANVFNTTYKNLVTDVHVGSTILIDDGLVELEVISVSDSALICRAMNDGVIGNKKSVNVPGVHINLPSLSAKDRDYIKFAVENDIDFIAHSFVRNRDDVMAVQSILDTYNSKVKIIAKIENREGVENIGEILDCVYGIMVARGDLGVEIPLEQVPLIQKKLIKECIKRAKPVITATQMLHSMIENPRPTRAEVSDIATAILDGTDAVMLSGETAYGKYPLEAVKAMRSVAINVEAQHPPMAGYPVEVNEYQVGNYLARTAVSGAIELGAKLILCDTETGFSARVISSYRGRIPVHACTHDMRVKRELALSYGVYASCVGRSANTDEMVRAEFKVLIDYNLIDPDDLVVILASTPDKKSGANLLEVNTARECI